MESPLRPEAHEEPSSADVVRATETVVGQLLERGINVEDSASPEDLVDLLEAVERFEGAVAEKGGDSFTNSLQSSQPENPDYVLPRRLSDESIAQYTKRIQEQADRVSGDSAR